MQFQISLLCWAREGPQRGKVSEFCLCGRTACVKFHLGPSSIQCHEREACRFDESAALAKTIFREIGINTETRMTGRPGNAQRGRTRLHMWPGLSPARDRRA